MAFVGPSEESRAAGALHEADRHHFDALGAEPDRAFRALAPALQEALAVGRPIESDA